MHLWFGCIKFMLWVTWMMFQCNLLCCNNKYIILICLIFMSSVLFYKHVFKLFCFVNLRQSSAMLPLRTYLQMHHSKSNQKQGLCCCWCLAAVDILQKPKIAGHTKHLYGTFESFYNSFRNCFTFPVIAKTK